MFPGAPEIEYRGVKHTVIGHGPRESILLKRMGHAVPPPILSYYDWPAPPHQPPFRAQRTTAALFTMEPRCYCLNDMGTGKTRSALWAWDYLNRAGCARKLLVVAKLSNLYDPWSKEAFTILPGKKVVVLHGTAAKRRALLSTDADIYLVNHDGVKVIGKELSARTDIDTIILDEQAVYRNNSDRSKFMRKFVERFAWVWGMTGSPMPRSPVDVWGQCKVVTPHTVPKYRKGAEEALMIFLQTVPFPITKPKPNATETAYSWMQPAVRFALDEVTELPPMYTPPPIEVRLTDEQKKKYTQLANECVAMIREKKVTAVNAGVLRGKLLQVGGGYVYTNNPEFVEIDSNYRKELLFDIIEGSPRKVIVWVPYNHLICGLSSYLEQKGIEHAVVHGDTKNRGEIFHDFQETAKYKVLLANPGCAGHGITLTAADTVVWYLPIDNYETYEQANARIRRVGQKHKQLFLRLCASSVERKMYRDLEKKEVTQEDFLQMFEEAAKELPQ